MEQHPIPQDVTGFQFKLIGSMTVKQFGYVAVGVIIAVVLYYLPLHFPLAFMVKLLLIPLSGGSGVVIAFVPIEGRPVDVMASNFFSAIFSPNQYVYHKQGRHFLFNTTTTIIPTPTAKEAAAKAAAVQKPKTPPTSKQQQLQQLLNAETGHVRNKLDEKEMSFLKSITSLPTQPIASGFKTAQNAVKAAIPTTPITPPKIISVQEENLPKPQLPKEEPKPTSSPSQKPEVQEQALVQQEASLEQQLDQAKKEESQTQTNPQIAAQAHQKVVELETQIQTIHAEKAKLEQEVIELRKQLNKTQAVPQPAVTPSAMPTPTAPPKPVQDAQHVRNVPQNMSKSVGLPHVPDTPNVITGIVKDPRGNILSSILVEVKDKEGNPVRAFKTNPLGQFASATPLVPGSYTIELEDPKGQQKFDVVQILVNNEILLPIEVISHDAREQLRKELFN
jgi:hypothetical protein